MWFDVVFIYFNSTVQIQYNFVFSYYQIILIMATVNFLYRSTKEKAPLNLRLLFRHENKDYVFGAKTKIEVSKNYWTKQHSQTRPKDIQISNKQNKVKGDINKLENYILEIFNTVNPETIDKNWLTKQVNNYYNPPQQNKEYSKDLLKYFDTFLKLKKTEITHSSIKKYNVIKKLLIRYENGMAQPLLIKDIDLKFKADFENFCLKHNYAPNTISRALRTIKTVCRHAKFNGLETSYQLDNIKPKYTKVDNVYLTFDEIEILKNIDNSKLIESHENARDWLIISCSLGKELVILCVLPISK